MAEGLGSYEVALDEWNSFSGHTYPSEVSGDLRAQPIWGIWEWSMVDPDDPDEPESEEYEDLVPVVSGLTADEAKAIVEGRAPWPE